MPVDLAATFAPWRNKHARKAWKPVCVDGGAGPAHFGGLPLLRSGEQWPTCTSCHAPMQLFLELPFASLPAAFDRRGEGTLQLFYCSVDAGDCETWSAFSGAHVARLLVGPATVATAPAGLTPLPVRTIEGWSEFLDHPHSEDHIRLGLVHDYDFKKKRLSLVCAELGISLRDLPIDLDISETVGDAEPGDKLGGWPAWVQGAEYPPCPECKRPMDLVFQIDSEDNVPHMFGDVGCGHITQCADHPHALAFGWACS